jgi:hypothetical protein
VEDIVQAISGLTVLLGFCGSGCVSGPYAEKEWQFSAMKRPRGVIESRWGVYALRKKAERIGEVRAAYEREAMQRALKDTQLENRSRFRISVRRGA